VHATSTRRLTPRDRVERVASRLIARLSARMAGVLAGEPVALDGLTLDPQIQLMLKALEANGPSHWSALGPAAARAEVRRITRVNAPARPPQAVTSELALPGPAGAIAARRYDGIGGRRYGGRPALVYFHGGGFVFGDLDTHDELCRMLAVHAQLSVIAIDYRLAPEAPFPAAVEDCLAAFRWVHANAAELALDPERLAVGGDSAGGNLAAVVSQQCAAEGAAGPAFQLLIYPVTDPDLVTRSSELFSKGFFLVEEDMDWFTQCYAAPAEDVRVSPLRAADLSDLPPAYIVTAGFDPLRDDGEAYGARLAEAGVPVVVRRQDGLIHGFANLTSISRASRDAVLELAGALQTGLALGSVARSKAAA